MVVPDKQQTDIIANWQIGWQCNTFSGNSQWVECSDGLLKNRDKQVAGNEACPIQWVGFRIWCSPSTWGYVTVGQLWTRGKLLSWKWMSTSHMTPLTSTVDILVTLSNVVHCKSYHHRHSFCSQMTYDIYLSNIMQKFPGFLGFYILIYILNCCFLLADCQVTVSCTQQRGLAGRVLSVYRYWIVSLSV